MSDVLLRHIDIRSTGSPPATFSLAQHESKRLQFVLDKHGNLLLPRKNIPRAQMSRMSCSKVAHGSVALGTQAQQARSLIMSKEKPNDDPREKTDWKPYPGTNEPWKEPNQVSQDPQSKPPPKPDLEKWQESNTH